MARGVRFLLGFRQYPFLKKNGPGIPVFGYCPLFKYIEIQKHALGIENTGTQYGATKLQGGGERDEG